MHARTCTITYSTVDTDETGKVGFREFMAWWREWGVRRSFYNFDLDGSGTIDSSKLGALLLDLGLDIDEVEGSEDGGGGGGGAAAGGSAAGCCGGVAGSDGLSATTTMASVGSKQTTLESALEDLDPNHDGVIRYHH
jgi:Ca2+-binding EF-hand superfamily protein